MLKIFIQIASYRDPQLIPTIRDALTQSTNPESLRFCIAWQHDEQETLAEFANHPQVTVIDIPYQESRGACWARNQIQQHYQGEDYTLCLDSHHRFVPGWDSKCIAMIRQLQEAGHAKPLLTTYAPPFDPENDPARRSQRPTRMEFDRFIPEGAIFFRPAALPKQTPAPVPARFFSAHMVFTLGRFCEEVQHDPEFYFHGEEISLAVRAFTHGYDLFHPHEIIQWHEYTRKGREKHWDNHVEWHRQNDHAHFRNRQLLGMEDPPPGEEPLDFGRYGLGTERTLREYERYAGVHFKMRAVSDHTRSHQPPPDPGAELSDEEWERTLSREFEHTIELDPEAPEAAAADDFWCVAYHDRDEMELFRRDLIEEELAEALRRTAEGEDLRIDSRFHAPNGRAAGEVGGVAA